MTSRTSPTTVKRPSPAVVRGADGGTGYVPGVVRVQHPRKARVPRDIREATREGAHTRPRGIASDGPPSPRAPPLGDILLDEDAARGRLRKIPPDPGNPPRLDEIRVRERAVDAHVRQFLSSLTERELKHPLVVRKGQGFDRTIRLPVRDRLWHRLEEELQHRGEVNALLWQWDVDPPTSTGLAGSLCPDTAGADPDLQPSLPGWAGPIRRNSVGIHPSDFRGSGGSATLTNCFPTLVPSKTRAKAAGAFSSPTTMSSFDFSWPDRSHPCIARTASGNLGR